MSPNHYTSICPACKAEISHLRVDSVLTCSCGNSFPVSSEDAKPVHGDAVKDIAGGEAEQATTGAVRSNLYPPGSKFPARYDLMFRNAAGMRRLAETWGEGFMKYGADNWMKGFPESVFIAHALEHIRLYLAGDISEDHAAHTAWNMLALAWVQENKPELLDLTKPAQQL